MSQPCPSHVPAMSQPPCHPSVYDESDIIFHLNSEDVRVENIPAVDHSRPALRNQALNKSYKFVEKDIELLKSRVYVG